MSSRWTWRLLALPGVAWLSIFFIVAFYAVIAVAFGNQDSFSQPVPFWNPLDWNVGYVLDVLRNIWHGDQYLTVFLRTFAFVAIAMAISLALGYPVAYFAARHVRGRRGAVVLLLLVLPFWINYLMRMLAWINLLSPGGWATSFLHSVGIERLFIWLGLLSTRGGWLDGQSSTVIIALVYGYVPYLILPLYAALGRIDQRQIEAARDLGASPLGGFLRVTLPLSVPAILAGVGAHRAADVRRLLHAGPRLRVDEVQHDREPDRPAHAAGLGEGRRRRPHAHSRARAARADVLLPAHDAPREPTRRRR